MEEKKEAMTPEAEQERIPNAVEAAQMARLSDEDLEGVSGGNPIDGVNEPYDEKDVFDRKGRWIGRKMLDWYYTERIYFYPCTCGRPMHKGTMGFWYCDPCDRFEMFPGLYYYTGTQAEFYQNFCR